MVIYILAIIDETLNTNAFLTVEAQIKVVLDWYDFTDHTLFFFHP